MQINTRLHSVTTVSVKAMFLAFDIALKSGDTSQLIADPNEWVLPASTPGALVAFGRWGAPLFAKSSLPGVSGSATFDFAAEVAEYLGLRPDNLVAAYIRDDGDCIFLVQGYGELKARVYVARDERDRRIGLREQAMQNLLNVETRLLRDRPRKHLFENHDVKFDVVVSDDPSSIVAFFGDEWGLLEPDFVILAPSDIKSKSDNLRDKRVICDYRAMSLRDAALCHTVLELSAQWPESKEIEAGFVRVRRERPYLDEIACWARERAENDEYARSMIEDLLSAEQTILIAQKQAIRAIAPTVARRLVHRHPDVGYDDSPERRAYHADVFGVVKRILELSQDEPLDFTLANVVFEACDDAWSSKPFAPEWVRDGEGRYAIRSWRGRHPDGSADIDFIARTPFDRENWTRVDFREVPDDVMFGLENLLDEARKRWWRAFAAETGVDIDATFAQ